MSLKRIHLEVQLHRGTSEHITNGVERTLSNRKTHISHIIMGQNCTALFFIIMDTEGEASVREQGGEEEEND